MMVSIACPKKPGLLSTSVDTSTSVAALIPTGPSIWYIWEHDMVLPQCYTLCIITNPTETSQTFSAVEFVYIIKSVRVLLHCIPIVPVYMEISYDALHLDACIIMSKSNVEFPCNYNACTL